MRRLCPILLISLALLPAGCEKRPPAARPDEAPAPFQAARHDHLPAFQIDSGRSELRIYVYRGGTLARLGHNHIVRSGRIRGTVWLGSPVDRSAFYLELPVRDFEVDPPALRRSAGEAFASQPSEQDIAGTRRNMLGRQLLHADRHPRIEIWSEKIRGRLPQLDATTRIKVRGQTHSFEVPFTVSVDDDTLTAEGSIEIEQSALGLTPFSIMMGAITVRDRLKIDYTFTASAQANGTHQNGTSP